MGKWTRRGFITTGLVGAGALVVGVGIRPGNRVSKLKGLVANEHETLVNAWVKITTDNRVVVVVPHCEMGQGVHTSLPMMLAEEMDAAWDTIDVMEAPDDNEYASYALVKGYLLGNTKIPDALMQTVDGSLLKITQLLKLQITGGSLSVRTTGVHAMQIAGAAAREMLVKSAAKQWQVGIDEIRTQDNFLYHDASQRKAPYAEFSAEASKLSPPSNPILKAVDEYKLLGTSPARLDTVIKVDGRAGFGIDTVLPKMVYATIKSAPVFGTKLISVDKSKVTKMAGLIKIVELESSVAVVAKGYWQALQVLNGLVIKWSQNETNQVSSKSLFAQFKTDMQQAEQQIDKETGDALDVISNASTIVEAQYQQPYLAHTPMEPLNCTAEVKNGKCRVWTGTQNPLGFRSEIANALDFDLDDVKVNNTFLGGGFGRRAISDYAIQAALIAAQLDSPVKLIWSREEDIRQDYYRQASVSQFKAALNTKGQPIAWINQYVDKQDPEEAPYIPYDIEHQLIQYTESPTHIPFGPWRSVDHSLHAFFTESFIDELANRNGDDSYLFRRHLLKSSPRFQAVLDKAALSAQWHKPLPKSVGRGIAIHQSFNTIVAQVAEVEVTNGVIRVVKVTCAVDAGFAVTPDGLTAQMESGIIYGLTAALYGEITIENGQVKQSNFHDYQALRINETPEIEVHIINSGEALGGGGEPGTPPIAPAVANAIFAASGKRIRSLPLVGKVK